MSAITAPPPGGTPAGGNRTISRTAHKPGRQLAHRPDEHVTHQPARRPLRRRALAVVTALLVLWGLVAAPSASAHAVVISTNPADGALLQTAPTQVSIVFSEAVELQLGAVRVFAPDGSRADVGSAGHPAGKADTVTIGLRPGLKNGTYVASWRVISADSHPVHGGFTFSIGTTSAPAAAGNTATPAGDKTVGFLFGIGRWLAFLGFALLVGPAFLALAGAPTLLRRKRARRVIAVGWFTLLFGTVVSLFLQGPYGAGFGLGKVFDGEVIQATMHTRLGTALAWRLVLLGAAGVLVSWLASQLADASKRSRLIAGAAGAAIAIGMAVTWAAADHSGTGDQVPLALPVDVAHLLAMAVWVGGLTVLTVAILWQPRKKAAADGTRAGVSGANGPETKGFEAKGSEANGSEAGKAADPEFTDADAVTAIRRFSPIALTAVAVLAASGTYQGWRQVRTWDALTTTDYGRLLLIKVCLVAIMIALGFLARRRLEARKPDLPTLRRSVAAEFCIALVVLAVTSVLVESQPARETVNRVISVSEPFDTGAPNGKGTVNMTLDPARVGIDTLHVYILGPDGQQESVPEVTAMLALPSQEIGPLPVKLQNAGPGHYISSTATFPYPGDWQVIVVVRTTDVDESTVLLNARVG